LESVNKKSRNIAVPAFEIRVWGEAPHPPTALCGGPQPSPRRGEGKSLMPSQNRQHQQGHNICDLDHGVYGGAGGVFVGVAYGVAGD
jgi:hypothetical protein